VNQGSVVNQQHVRAARFVLTALAFFASPSFALAQSPPRSAPAPQELSAELETLRKSLQEAQDAYRAELDALYADFDEQKATDEERALLEKKRAEIDARDPSPRFVKEFGSLAERAKGTPVAAEALMQVLELDRTPSNVEESAGRKALATLLTEHIQSPALSRLPTIVQYASSVDRALRNETYAKLASDSPIAEVKAESLFLLAVGLTADESRGGDRPRARQLFAELQTRFGGLKSPQQRTYSALAEGFLFELDHLQLGMQAPDFEATDENGVKFKLSDYSGKVVIVDFWGFW
jgi:hypothetical protein